MQQSYDKTYSRLVFLLFINKLYSGISQFSNLISNNLTPWSSLVSCVNLRAILLQQVFKELPAIILFRYIIALNISLWKND